MSSGEAYNLALAVGLNEDATPEGQELRFIKEHNTETNSCVNSFKALTVVGNFLIS